MADQNGLEEHVAKPQPDEHHHRRYFLCGHPLGAYQQPENGIFNNLVKNIVGFYSGYVQVHKQGYWNEQILDNSFTATTEIERSILSDRNISSPTPRLESFALVSSGETTRGALVVGINPQTENRVTSLAKTGQRPIPVQR